MSIRRDKKIITTSHFYEFHSIKNMCLRFFENRPKLTSFNVGTSTSKPVLCQEAWGEKEERERDREREREKEKGERDDQ